MDYMITGTGDTVQEAMETFKDGYEDMKRYYKEEGKDFEEVSFDFQYDIASFLQHYAYAFSLAGLERITGVNQKQLSHYISGYRHPSEKTVRKIECGIRKFRQELSSMHFF